MISCCKYYETATSKEVGRKQGRCQVLGGPRLLLGTEILNTIKESRKSHAWREVKIPPFFEDSTVVGRFLASRLLPCILVYLCGCLAVMIQRFSFSCAKLPCSLGQNPLYILIFLLLGVFYKLASAARLGLALGLGGPNLRRGLGEGRSAEEPLKFHFLLPFSFFLPFIGSRQ